MEAKTKLSLIDKIILWLNGLLCSALIISYFAPTVDPKKVWEIAFFGLAYPFLLIANIIILMWWLLRGRWYWLVSFICIAGGWNVLNNTIGFHVPRAHSYAPNLNIIHVMTYNVHDFKRYGSKNDISTKHEILDIISQQRPDIICFQEFYTRNQGEYDMRDSIVNIMGAAFYYFEPIIFNKSEAIGIAIFSRFPIIGQGLIPLSDKKSENACIYIDVKKGGNKLRVYSVHLQSIRFDPEDYKYINNITRQGTPDMSSARRLGSKLKNAFIKRSGQVVKIKEHTAHCPYPYIISGDFNDTPSSYAVNYMAKGLKNAFREKGYGFGRTYNGNFPNFQIDYVMASPQFEVLDYQIIEKKLSDHYPVRSDLSLSH
ncbi:MAG TPA: endonuclease/exonuclease/phosphatase family protein [Mucilaginibacter sp.]|jgi:endonuclease/exonuclease/phosphatase family metal-dependent hydrolase